MISASELVAKQHMAKVVSRRQTQENIKIRQSEIRIQHHNFLAQFGKTNRQIGNHVGFAHAAFSAGYRHYLGSLSFNLKDCPLGMCKPGAALTLIRGACCIGESI